MIVDILLFLAGMAVIFVAADKMVLATGRLASQIGLSPVIVGAVVIGFGSSLPEMLVSVLALDQPNGLDLAVGNLVGSNIANISLVLAVSVIFYPIRHQAEVLKREGALMLAALLIASSVLWDSRLTVVDGSILLVALVVAAVIVVRWAKSSSSAEVEVVTGSDERTVGRDTIVAIASLAGLIGGARAMVIGAENIALEVGLNEGVVGLTVLALGTSLPELSAVIASARRGRNDLVLGNVLGSNIFNALGVAGVTGVFGAGALVTDFRPDLVVMVAVALIAGVAAWSGDRLRRIEGAFLLAAYPVTVLLAL